MDPIVRTMYILFLKWGFPLITYDGEVYFTNRKVTEQLCLDRFDNQEFNEFLNKYAIIDRKKERERYNRAKTFVISGQEVE